MTFLRNSLAGLALILAVTLSVIIGVAIASFLPRVSRDGGGEVSISGIGNNLNGGYNSSSAVAARLARRAAESDAVPQVTDQTLHDVAPAITVKAREGDVNAAAFVFELADAQKKLRAEAAKTAATRPREGP